MYGEDKVWIVDLGDEIEGNQRPGAGPSSQPAAGSVAPRGSARQSASALRGTDNSSRRKPLRTSSLPYHYLALAALVAGPWSVLLTPCGRQHRSWVVLSVVTGSAWLLFLLAQAGTLTWSGRVAGSLAAGTALMILTILGGFTAWSHGLLMAGRDGGQGKAKVPAWMRRPALAGLWGLLAPGLGLLLLGRGRRAANALWLVGPMAVSLLLLARVPAFWQWNRSAGEAGLPDPIAEGLLIVPVAILLVGVLLWLIQALTGVRLAILASPSRHPRRGDAITVGLLLALGLFAWRFDQAAVASDLDRFAVYLHHEGLQTLPLHLEQAATRLDPSRPVYVLRAADLLENLGEAERAERMRDEMAERWEPYAARVEHTADIAATGGYLPAPSVGRTIFASMPSLSHAAVSSVPGEPDDRSSIAPAVLSTAADSVGTFTGPPVLDETARTDSSAIQRDASPLPRTGS